MNRLCLAILATLLLAACMPVVDDRGLTTDSPDFTVTAEPGTWKGRPVVAGYVRNKRPMEAAHIQLRVDSLDATGAVVASELGHLDRDIPPDDRVYFEVPVSAAAPAYRVTVAYVFWRAGGGSGGSM